jgi:hypothetical protein
MGEWDRRIPWRQGHILTADVIASLRLAPDSDPAQHVGVVVTHDCDLAQSPDVEPVVEVIVGHRVESGNGNFTHGKNPRRLHLSAVEAGTIIWIELTATARQSVPKQDLVKHAPSATSLLDSSGLNTLQHWLAARYRRSAFPDAFDRHLNETGVAGRLARILGPLGNHVVAVFFDVEEGKERKHDDGDPFTLSIHLLYSTAADPHTAQTAANSSVQAVTAAFHDRCWDKKMNKWRGIELVECSAISDQALTYAMSLQLKRWNADYVSLRAEPVQPMLEE